MLHVTSMMALAPHEALKTSAASPVDVRTPTAASGVSGQQCQIGFHKWQIVGKGEVQWLFKVALGSTGTCSVFWKKASTLQWEVRLREEERDEGLGGQLQKTKWTCRS